MKEFFYKRNLAILIIFIVLLLIVILGIIFAIVGINKPSTFVSIQTSSTPTDTYTPYYSDYTSSLSTPADLFADTRNATRSANVNTILNAVTQYLSEQGHSINDFGTIHSCRENPLNNDQIGTASGDVNLTSYLVPTYIVEIPIDPSNGTIENTGYYVCMDGSRLKILAPYAEVGRVISVER